jgi:predicted glycosyl hydrolase (DUF1957 family)
MPAGELAIVLHTHMPYVESYGRIDVCQPPQSASAVP